MPIVAEQREPKRRQAALWLLAIVLACSSPVGLVVWSFIRPVYVGLGSRRLHFGRVQSREMPFLPRDVSGKPTVFRYYGFWSATVAIPGEANQIWFAIYDTVTSSMDIYENRPTGFP
jgi:hypothetical protein